MGAERQNYTHEILLSEDLIRARVKELANEISQDYKGKKPLFIGVLKGSFIFLADLMRELDPEISAEVDFMAVSSYGRGTVSSRQPKIELDLRIPIEDREVLLVEDIVDAGYSLEALIALLSVRNPKSLKTCALLSKKSRREVEVPIDYLGFEIPDLWIEGYGTDTAEQNRGLKNVVHRKPS